MLCCLNLIASNPAKQVTGQESAEKGQKISFMKLKIVAFQLGIYAPRETRQPCHPRKAPPPPHSIPGSWLALHIIKWPLPCQCPPQSELVLGSRGKWHDKAESRSCNITSPGERYKKKSLFWNDPTVRSFKWTLQKVYSWFQYGVQTTIL